MKFEFPDSPSGIHPPTAALTRILRHKEIRNPLTRKPYSEAFLLGLGGGLGTGYILFPFKHLPHPMLRLGFRNQWNNPKAFLKQLTDRLNLKAQFDVFETGITAQKALQDTLAQNNPAIVWVDKALLPYHGIPESMEGFINYQVAVHARDGRLWRLYLDDLSSRSFEIREKVFTSARANLHQNKFLMMTLKSAQDLSARELRKAIIQSIEGCTRQLTQPLKTIGISTLETWAEDLADHQNHNGWSQVLDDQEDLFSVLKSIYVSIKLDGTEGFALRKLYSDFLHEAAGYLNNPKLNAVAGQYLQLSTHWSNLADNALPSWVPDFDRFKILLTEKFKAYKISNLDGCRKTQNRLKKQQSKILRDFPLDRTKISQLFERLSSQIKLISELELSAAQNLGDVIR